MGRESMTGYQPEQNQNDLELSAEEVDNNLQPEVNADRIQPLEMQALHEETTLFGKLRGKARSVSKILMLSTALSITGGGAQVLAAEHGKDPVEQADSGEKQEQKSNWATKILNKFKADLKEVTNKEDLNWVARDAAYKFNQEFFFPETDANGKKLNSALDQMMSTADRVITHEEAVSITKAIEEFFNLLEKQDAKYGTNFADAYRENLENIIGKVKSQSSIAHRKEQEMLKNFGK
jgi:hypothetical protein